MDKQIEFRIGHRDDALEVLDTLKAFFEENHSDIANCASPEALQEAEAALEALKDSIARFII